MNKINLHINETKIRRLPLVLLLTCLPLFTTTMRGQSNGISLDVPRIVPVSPAVTEMGNISFIRLAIVQAFLILQFRSMR